MLRAIFRAILCSLVFTSLACGSSLPRVASLNVCTDQLLLQLADPVQIVGLSSLAQDCWSSVLCEQSKNFPVLHPTAEAIIAAHPDVLLGGEYMSANTVQAVREYGVKTIMLPPVNALDEIPSQIMTVADAIGASELGKQIVQAFVARLAQLSSENNADDPTAAVYMANGFVTHAGSLPDDVIRHAGFRNYATVIGYQSPTRIPLELLIAQPPDLLILDRSGQGNSFAQSMLDHPALEETFSRKRRLDMPARLWLCGLPQTLDAVSLLRGVRHQIKDPGP